MLINQRLNPYRPRQLLSPQGPDGMPGLGKTRSGKLLGLLHRFEDSWIGPGALSQQRAPFNLKNKTRESVGQTVKTHLQPLAFQKRQCGTGPSWSVTPPVIA